MELLKLIVELFGGEELRLVRELKTLHDVDQGQGRLNQNDQSHPTYRGE